MPHWHEKHSLRTLHNKLADALRLVDELLTRRSATRRFNRNAAGAMKKIMSAVRKKPKHYTSRQLVSKFKEFGKGNVLAAIDDLQEKGSITFARKGGKKGKKGQYVALPPSRKAT